MAHITLSIPDEVYAEMKNHPEIKWSEIARHSIIQKTISLSRTINSKELLNQLPKETRDSILKSKENESVEFYKRVKKEGLKRTKYLTQAVQ